MGLPNAKTDKGEQIQGEHHHPSIYWLSHLGTQWEIYRQNRMGIIGIALLMLFALMAVASFILPHVDPMYRPMSGVDPNIAKSVGPSTTHLLGTDFMGRDIFSQLLTGARIAFMVGISAAFMVVAVGTLVGLIAGYFGKLLDILLMRVADIIMVLPSLLVIIILSAVVGHLSIWNLVIIIAIMKWGGAARVIRSQTLSLRERPYIEAAIVAGASHGRIIAKHLLPNVLPFSFMYMTFAVNTAIIVEAALSFLGFGDPSTVSWGMMLQWVWKTGHMFKAPYWLLPPGLCLSLITLSFYMVGRALEEVINPTLRAEVVE
jgi:peptide/nickel transport system permease protein